MGRPIHVIMEYGQYLPNVDGSNTDAFVKNYRPEYNPYGDGNPKFPITDEDYYYDKYPFSITSCRHISDIVATIKKWKKADYDVWVVPYKYADKFLADNRKDIFLLTGSVGYFLNDGVFLPQYKDDFYMSISAGNDDKRGEGLGSSLPYWTSIGAINTSTGLPEYYSSYGKGWVDFVGKTGETLEYDYFGKKIGYVQGTSFANPQHGTQIMNLMVGLYNKYKVKPSIKEVLAIRDKYVQDINIPNIDGVGYGLDLRTGFGYYEFKDEHIMPKKEIKMQIGNVNMKLIENGIEKSVILDVPPTVVNNRTMLPVRVLAETLGLFVYWDEATKTAILVQY